MIVIHHELISPPNAATQAILSNSLLISMGKEISEFRGFNEDLSNMTEPWRAAMQDVLTPIDDEEQGFIE